MTEKQNYTARCDQQGHILVKMPGCEYGIEDKEVSIKLAHSILSAVDDAWLYESENEFTMNGINYVAIDEDKYNQCENCAFVDNIVYCYNSNYCESHNRNDGRNIIWKIKD